MLRKFSNWLPTLSFVLLTGLFTFPQLAWSEAQTCKALLKSSELKEQLQKARESYARYNPWAKAARAAKAYNHLPQWAKSYLPEEQVVAILQDYEMSLFIESLYKVIKNINALEAQPTTAGEQLLALIKAFEVLPLNSAEKLIGRGEILTESLSTSSPQVLRALGFRNLSEMQDLLYGKSLAETSRDSLVGYYMEQTGAQSVMTSFKKGPRRGRGEARLALALSRKSMALYNKLFTLPEFFYHVHYPEQGTLLVAHRGRAGTYAKLEDKLRRPSLGTLMPLVLMQSSEANRMTNYFGLSEGESMHDENEVAQEPWQLEGYCAMGGYDSCTHWVGNIPIGDKTVSAYVFPGKVDEHADNNVGKGAQKQKLNEYEHKSPMVHLVWQVPGREQLADVLGVRSANTSGELANPGWVLHTLVGVVSPQRVPVVFIVVQDHRKPLPQKIDEQTDAY